MSITIDEIGRAAIGGNLPGQSSSLFDGGSKRFTDTLAQFRVEFRRPAGSPAGGIHERVACRGLPAKSPQEAARNIHCSILIDLKQRGSREASLEKHGARGAIMSQQPNGAIPVVDAQCVGFEPVLLPDKR